MDQYAVLVFRGRNLSEDQQIAPRDHAKIVNNIANQFWHSDSSFQKPAARYSMLHSVVIPAKGGETEFADLRAAYDALPVDLRKEIASLEAEHHALHSRLMLGMTMPEGRMLLMDLLEHATQRREMRRATTEDVEESLENAA